MKLENTFMVPVPVEDAWRVLLDVEQVAPCLPGAVVEAVQGDDVVGRVKVRLGPIALTYRGMLTFVERDEDARKVVMSARATEARGSGTAEATITTALSPLEGETRVSVDTVLNVTGKPAQFGRGVMQDVSGNLLQQFAASLAKELEGETIGENSGTAQRPRPVAHAVSSAASDDDGAARRPRASGAIDVVDAVGRAVASRAAPVVGGALTGLLVGWWLSRRG